MDNKDNTHIVKYRTYLFVLITLIVFTFISVAITGIQLGKLAVVGALVLASFKSSLVLWYFMHLKYENQFLRLMVGLVLFVFIAVLIVTFFDYSFQ
ncbi:MAG: cytochrome C oxidase subunit IV family protein [Bacteroidales bacterium]|nr:cytochrome C oxidase subunit IV family protein [Bacteroidales bacterium]